MAFLRETVGSLRVYFILVAAVSALFNVANLLGGARGLVTVISSLVGLGLALAYFNVGVRLKRLLVTSPTQITGVLMAGAVFVMLVFLFEALSGVPGETPVLGLLIVWYLYRNVRRLAAEAHPNPDAAEVSTFAARVPGGCERCGAADVRLKITSAGRLCRSCIEEMKATGA
jgi:hypothetical protein